MQTTGPRRTPIGAIAIFVLAYLAVVGLLLAPADMFTGATGTHATSP